MDARKARIAELSWRLHSRKPRGEIRSKLGGLPVAFLTRTLSNALSSDVGKHVSACIERSPQNLDLGVTQFLDAAGPDEAIVAFHSLSKIAGALVVPARDAPPVLQVLRTEFGPDLWITTTDASMGLAFEQDEYECFLRWWGIEVEPGRQPNL